MDKCEQVTIVLHSFRVIIDLLFFGYFGLSFKAMFKAKKTDICISIFCFILGLIIMCLGSCIQSTMMLLFSSNESTDERSIGFLIFLAVYAALIAPIFEEIEYRMLLFVGILKKTNKLILAILILFSLNSIDVEASEEIITQNEVVFNIVVNLILAFFWMILLFCLLAIVFYRIKKKLPNQKINLNDIKMNDKKGFVSVGLMIVYFVICIGDWILLGLG